MYVAVSVAVAVTFGGADIPGHGDNGPEDISGALGANRGGGAANNGGDGGANGKARRIIAPAGNPVTCLRSAQGTHIDWAFASNNMAPLI